ncbi:hypothetical protein CIB48_g3644 [Xylaria polymorpha]|nr:hypothetical protein CIB48_g3644 [Xylaria polymorpha]
MKDEFERERLLSSKRYIKGVSSINSRNGQGPGNAALPLAEPMPQTIAGAMIRIIEGHLEEVLKYHRPSDVCPGGLYYDASKYPIPIATELSKLGTTGVFEVSLALLKVGATACTTFNFLDWRYAFKLAEAWAPGSDQRDGDLANTHLESGIDTFRYKELCFSTLEFTSTPKMGRRPTFIFQRIDAVSISLIVTEDSDPGGLGKQGKQGIQRHSPEAKCKATSYSCMESFEMASPTRAVYDEYRKVWTASSTSTSGLGIKLPMHRDGLVRHFNLPHPQSSYSRMASTPLLREVPITLDRSSRTVRETESFDTAPHSPLPREIYDLLTDPDAESQATDQKNALVFSLSNPGSSVVNLLVQSTSSDEALLAHARSSVGKGGDGGRGKPQWPKDTLHSELLVLCGLRSTAYRTPLLYAVYINQIYRLIRSTMSASLTSTQTVHGGQTPSKPGHYFSAHPPTSDANSSQALRDYSLAAFIRAPNSTPLSSSLSAQEIEAAHRARVAAQIKELERHLP